MLQVNADFFKKSFPKNPEKRAFGIENLIGFGGWLLNFYTMLSYRNKKNYHSEITFWRQLRFADATLCRFTDPETISRNKLEHSSQIFRSHRKHYHCNEIKEYTYISDRRVSTPLRCLYRKHSPNLSSLCLQYFTIPVRIVGHCYF